MLSETLWLLFRLGEQDGARNNLKRLLIDDDAVKRSKMYWLLTLFKLKSGSQKIFFTRFENVLDE